MTAGAHIAARALWLGLALCMLLTAPLAARKGRPLQPRLAVAAQLETLGTLPSGATLVQDCRELRVGRHVLAQIPCTQRPSPVLDPAGLTPIPQMRPALWPGDHRTGWLIEPTDRYRHGVLGDAIEAGAMAVGPQNGVMAGAAIHRLDEAEVFEDTHLRFVELDEDPRPEVMVVISHARTGASLALFDVSADHPPRLGLLARTPPIGRPNRWLNPLGVADFDGDGVLEVALVRTPHIGGILQVWTYRDGALSKDDERPGISTHRLGSAELDLMAVLDVDGDGRPEIIVPTQDLKTLLVLGLDMKKGLFDQTQITLPAAVVGPIAEVATSARWVPHLYAVLEDEQLIRINWVGAASQ